MKPLLPLLASLTLLQPLIAETVQPVPPGLHLWSRSEATLPDSESGGFSTREILVAIREAYPRRVREIAWRGDDWALRVDDEWFLWADGRFLPPAEAAAPDLYDPVPFYPYYAGPLRMPEYTDAERAELEALAAEFDREPRHRHQAFMNALWRTDGRTSSYDRQKTTYFLGMKTMIHRDLLEDLAAVEERILAAAGQDAEVAGFVANLRGVEGYNFRRVDGTATLSNHAYGVAVDLLPVSYNGRQVYWRWARDGNVDWLGLDESNLYTVPQPIVEAFERHGFVWGGKWRFFDTIHFEYRPEILLLNGFDVDLR